MSRIKRFGVFALAIGVATFAAAALWRSSTEKPETGAALSDRASAAMPPAGPIASDRGGFPFSKALSKAFSKADPREGRGTFIVMFDEAPLATYRGDVAGIPAPSRRLAKSGRMRLDPTSDAARAYVDYLQKRQTELKTRMSSMVGRELRPRMSMQHAVNATVVDLSREEAEAIRGLAGVNLVEEYEEFELLTDRGPQLIGAEPVWDGTNPGAGGVRYRGEGMVVAILDSGINFGSPSFAATGPVDGYVHVNPLGNGNYLGSCASGGVDIGRCNAKLIGGFDYVCGTPGDKCGAADTREEPGFGDTNGHGTHVASTAAGNLRDADFSGAPRRISGVAPHANIIAYDICYTNTAENNGLCPNVSAVAAMNHLVSTGLVDAVNYSIAGGDDAWTDTVSVAFLNAVEAGIYISAAGGNAGPAPDTVSHIEPWVATSAAVQHGRGGFAIQLSVTGPAPVPANLTSISATEGTGGTPHTGAIANTPLKISPSIDTADDGCNGYPPGTFNGTIAVIRRGTCAFSTKVGAASATGAIAVIIANNVAGDLVPSVPSTSVPAFAVKQTDGDALRDFASTRPSTTATIGFPSSPAPNTPDVVASFSSRGPSVDASGDGVNVMKPDFSAPGASILAADAGTSLTGFESLVGMKSGTSMATPHHAGAVLLLRQARPTWSVPEAKSAFALTAYDQVLATNETSPATPFDTGSGRIRVDRAINSGLVMHETAANYRAANPDAGGNPTTLNQPSLYNNQCGSACNFTRTFRNPHATASTWNLQLQGVPGTVPASITVPAGGSVSVAITVRPAGATDSWWFGSLTMTPVSGSTTPLRLPIAIKGAATAVNLVRDDTNGDGRSDVIWRQNTTNQMAFWQMNGASVSGYVIVPGQAGYSIVATGDFNGDSRFDVLWDNGGTLILWTSTGNGFTSAQVASYGGGWQLAAVTDVNGDGRADIIWIHPQQGQMAFWFMNGATVQGHGFQPALLGYTIIGAGDFNGDGRFDLLWDNGGTVYLWTSTGTAFDSTLVASYGDGWKPEAAADVNGDGRMDIVWRQLAQNQIAYWFMNGATVTGTGVRAGLAGYSIIGTGDFNGDGRFDILWDNTGTLFVWLSTGTDFDSQHVASYGDGWVPWRNALKRQ